jgi:hypothetical protein
LLREQKLLLTVSLFILAVTDAWFRFLFSRNDGRGVLPLELLTSGSEKVQRSVGLDRENG